MECTDVGRRDRQDSPWILDPVRGALLLLDSRQDSLRARGLLREGVRPGANQDSVAADRHVALIWRLRQWRRFRRLRYWRRLEIGGGERIVRGRRGEEEVGVAGEAVAEEEAEDAANGVEEKADCGGGVLGKTFSFHFSVSLSPLRSSGSALSPQPTSNPVQNPGGRKRERERDRSGRERSYSTILHHDCVVVHLKAKAYLLAK